MRSYPIIRGVQRAPFPFPSEPCGIFSGYVTHDNKIKYNNRINFPPTFIHKLNNFDLLKPNNDNRVASNYTSTSSRA